MARTETKEVFLEDLITSHMVIRKLTRHKSGIKPPCLKVTHNLITLAGKLHVYLRRDPKSPYLLMSNLRRHPPINYRTGFLFSPKFCSFITSAFNILLFTLLSQSFRSERLSPSFTIVSDTLYSPRQATHHDEVLFAVCQDLKFTEATWSGFS